MSVKFGVNLLGYQRIFTICITNRQPINIFAIHIQRPGASLKLSCFKGKGIANVHENRDYKRGKESLADRFGSKHTEFHQLSLLTPKMKKKKNSEIERQDQTAITESPSFYTAPCEPILLSLNQKVRDYSAYKKSHHHP